jgi:hypothetical protein
VVAGVAAGSQLARWFGVAVLGIIARENLELSVPESLFVMGRGPAFRQSAAGGQAIGHGRAIGP